MKIASLAVEMLRADPASAHFLIRVVLDGPATGCEVRGRVVGPHCPGVTTVEIAYPLVNADVRDTTRTLKGVVPEPNLWTPETPFVYVIIVEVWTGDRQTDSRRITIALKGRAND
jgi:hypothetical protein